MPVVFDQPVNSVEEIVAALRQHGDALRGTYRARYVFDRHSLSPYSGATLERPPCLQGNPLDVVYPWEQIFLAAAACVGSDYPMLAAHFGVALDRVELVVEGVFDPRGEFDGLLGYHAPAEAAPCFLFLHVRVALTSSAAAERWHGIHERVMSTNMVPGGTARDSSNQRAAGRRAF
jgi:hypothetical protein